MNSTPLRLLHITDPHLLGDESLEIYDVNTAVSLRQVLQQALAESPVPPDAILVTGDNGDWTILLLDSRVPREPSVRIAASEFARLESALSTTLKRPVLVRVHHLPVAVGSAWLDAVELQNGPDLLTMIDRFPQAPAVLAGHVHQAFDAVAGRVRMIATRPTDSRAAFMA